MDSTPWTYYPFSTLIDSAGKLYSGAKVPVSTTSGWVLITIDTVANTPYALAITVANPSYPRSFTFGYSESMILIGGTINNYLAMSAFSSAGSAQWHYAY
jgi:hypothetical protein